MKKLVFGFLYYSTTVAMLFGLFVMIQGCASVSTEPPRVTESPRPKPTPAAEVSSAAPTPAKQPQADSGWIPLELGPVGDKGVRKIKQNVSGFEIRYALGLRDMNPVDIEVYDSAGRLILKTDRLDQRPRECMWSDDRTAIVIDGQTFRITTAPP